jgi:hypothetical protein
MANNSTQSVSIKSLPADTPVWIKGSKGNPKMAKIASSRGRRSTENKNKIPVFYRGKIQWFNEDELQLVEVEKPTNETPTPTPPQAKEPEPTPNSQTPISKSPTSQQVLMALSFEAQDEISIAEKLDASVWEVRKILAELSPDAVESISEGISVRWRLTGISLKEQLDQTFSVQVEGEEVKVRKEIQPATGYSYFTFSSPSIGSCSKLVWSVPDDIEKFVTDFVANRIKSRAVSLPIVEGSWVAMKLNLDQTIERINNNSEHQLHGFVLEVVKGKASVLWQNGSTSDLKLEELVRLPEDIEEKVNAQAKEEWQEVVAQAKGKEESKGKENLSIQVIQNNFEIAIQSLDEFTAKRVQLRTERIRANKNKVVVSLLEIGKDLIGQKEDIGKLDGAWSNWLHLNGWEDDDGEREAQYLMAIAHVFGDLDPKTFSLFDATALKLLSARHVSKSIELTEIRNEFIAQAKAGKRITHKEVKEALNAVKKSLPESPSNNASAQSNNGSTNETSTATGVSSPQRSPNVASVSPSSPPTSVSAELKEKAQSLGVSGSSNQVLPDTNRNESPAETDDTAFAAGMDSGSGSSASAQNLMSEQDEVPLPEFVSNLSEDEAEQILVAIAEHFGARKLEEVLNQFNVNA